MWRWWSAPSFTGAQWRGPAGWRSWVSVVKGTSGVESVGLRADAADLEFPAGTDFGPMLEGLPDDMCPARHWGYVIEGVIEVRYSNDTDETIQAGDLFYMPAGHTAKVVDDVKFVEFSPADEAAEVDQHLQAKMG